MAPEPMEEGPTAQHPAEGLNDEAKKFYKMIDDTKHSHKENNSLVFLNVIIYIFFYFVLYYIVCYVPNSSSYVWLSIATSYHEHKFSLL